MPSSRGSGDDQGKEGPFGLSHCHCVPPLPGVLKLRFSAHTLLLCHFLLPNTQMGNGRKDPRPPWVAGDVSPPLESSYPTLGPQCATHPTSQYTLSLGPFLPGLSLPHHPTCSQEAVTDLCCPDLTPLRPGVSG